MSMSPTAPAPAPSPGSPKRRSTARTRWPKSLLRWTGGFLGLLAAGLWIMTGWGLGRLYNGLLFPNNTDKLPWGIVSIAIGGLILIIKALWDLSVGRSGSGE